MLNKLDRYKTTFEDQVRAARSSAPASEPVFSSVSLVFGLFILEGARLQAAAQLRVSPSPPAPEHCCHTAIVQRECLRFGWSHRTRRIHLFRVLVCRTSKHR